MASLATESSNASLSARRNKPAKAIPRLPMSAFSPPNSGTGERFPLPPSPTTVHPTTVLDSSAAISSIDTLGTYTAALGTSLSSRLSGVVVSVPESAVGSVDQLISSSKVPVVAISVPLSDSSPAVAAANIKVVSNTAFTQTSPNLVQSVKQALAKGVVEINVKSDLSTDAGWEALEEFLTSVLEGRDPEATKPAIILSNVLPPADSMDKSTVSLLSHPSYLAYQAHSATLSFYEPVYVRLSPPDTDNTVPSDASATLEWTNRLKMYLGPIIEAFGFNRIIFATSSSQSGSPGNWYEMAREAVAELGIDQEGVDAIFGGNAKAVYGA
ncbi:hypothetical protein M408DRAFT_328214 [Serendipita vermifera MAFF 305830]|uniref:Amidohydrolase-related domain-containing protein n=1 Tax=Serendipita vermifera MAFF 305830 TaxID=933852 RepID=A0A0C3B1I6_SERVB|nr:hypothetical protein M408DRAFT_328214 [Serendipita vermifera MAFF 305830]